jgi:hypothetical protein
MYTSTLAATLALAALVTARTDLAGCTSTLAGNTYTYYVPGTGEICAFLDCGGGRAPPKTDVPGCPQYAGTASYEPSFLAGYGSSMVMAASSAYSAGEIPTSEAVVTSAQTTVVETAPTAGAEVSSTLATITSVVAPLATGTGSAHSGSAVASGGNNVTATATLSRTGSASLPAGTGAAGMVTVAGKGVMVLAGVVGLAVL